MKKSKKIRLVLACALAALALIAGCDSDESESAEQE